MANRYWRGGTASWDGTAGTKWADTVGGAGGATVPTTADDVFFDATSGAVTCTISTGNTGAKSINCTGFTGTLTGTAGISLGGSVTLVAGMTYSHTGSMTFTGSGTLTTAGKTFSGVTVSGIGITLTLGDALNTGARSIVVTQGTFNTANFSVVAGAISSTSVSARTITLGSSTITLSSSTTPINFTNATSLTLTANTSQINISSASGDFNGGSKTFHNVTFTSGAFSDFNITGANTFNNFSTTARSTAGIGTLFFPAGFTTTFTGQLSLVAGPTGGGRLRVRSSAQGTSATLSAQTLAALTDIDFRDITAAGASAGSPWSGTRIGDETGNSNITFTAPKTVYWNFAGGAFWNGTVWALSSGGGTSTANFPLAQDTVIVVNTGLNTGATITLGWDYSIGTLDFSGRTNAFTFATGTNQPPIFGNLIFNTSLTSTGTGTWFLANQAASQTITTGGATITPPVEQININQTVAITGNTTFSSTYTLTHGTLDLTNSGAGNFTLTCGVFSSSNANTRAITFGLGNIALASTNSSLLAMGTATNFSMTTSGGGFTRNQIAVATLNFGATAGGTASNAPNLTVNAGSSTLTITTGSYFKNVDFTGSTCSVSATYNACGNLTLASGGTYTSVVPTFLASGTITSVGKTLGNPVTVNGSGITVTLGDALTLGTGSTFTLTQGTLDLNGNTLSTGIFSSSTTNTRAITFGSANIALSTTSAGTVALSMATATNFSMTTSGGGFTRNQAATATINFGGTAGGTASNAPNLTVNAGSSTLTIANGSYFKNVVFTGSTSTVNAANLNVAGNLTLAVGGTYTSLVSIFIASGTITSVGKTLASAAVNGSGITLTLGDACTVLSGGTFTLTAGTLDLNGNTLSTGAFSSSSTGIRAITFGSANIVLTSTSITVVLGMATATNFTWTGTGGFTRNQATTATIQFGYSAGGTASNAPNLTVNGGASALTITTGSYLKNVDFTGSTCSVSATYNVCGNLTLASGGTYTSVVPTFIASGTLTSTGKTLGNTTVNGSGITVTLADQAECPTLTFVQGTLNLAGFTFTSTTSATTSGVGTKNLTFNGGTLVCSAASATAWNNAGPTGFTTTAGAGTGTISMTAATAKTFVGGGSTYNCTLNQGGAGTLTITGANTFNNITNSNATASQITFPASTTTTVSSFTLSGSAGNLVSLRSSTPATQFTLSDASGTVSVSYLDIQDSNATGGAVWEAYLTNGNVNSGNNTGWIFSLAGGNFFLLF